MSALIESTMTDSDTRPCITNLENTPQISLAIPAATADAHVPLLPLSIRRTKRKHCTRRRLHMYLTDEVMPRPTYRFTRIEKSKKEHKLRMRQYLERFDAIMESNEG